LKLPLRYITNELVPVLDLEDGGTSTICAPGGQVACDVTVVALPQPDLHVAEVIHIIMISIDKAAILISLLFAFNKYLRFAVDGFLLETTCFRRTHSSGQLRRHTSKPVYLLRFNNSHSCLRRFLSKQPPPSPSDDTIVDYTQEETLLCISMTTQPGITLNDALLCLSKFCQTFPFAAVLPVQPLFYIPMKDDGGVEIKFLRKKTPDRSGVDGGIRFFLRSAVPDGNDDDNNEDTANYDPSCSNNGEQPNNCNPSPIVE
jgi:hypothetical protein